MYDVSALWRQIVNSDDCRYEISVVIGESGRLITNGGDAITFGGAAILIGQTDADAGYQEEQIMSLSTAYRLFSEEHPCVGACLSAELDVTMLRPAGAIPRMALVRPYVRATAVVHSTGSVVGVAVAGSATVGAQPSTTERVSEWIPQGVFYIDTREYTQNDDELNLMTLHCYDAMLMTEQDYPETDGVIYPARDVDIVNIIAGALGVSVDARTWEIMTDGYMISLPAGYTMREVLSNIAAMYCGNWVMNYDGELLLVALNGIPAETNYLVDEFGACITFGVGAGATRILV